MDPNLSTSGFFPCLTVFKECDNQVQPTKTELSQGAGRARGLRGVQDPSKPRSWQGRESSSHWAVGQALDLDMPSENEKPWESFVSRAAPIEPVPDLERPMPNHPKSAMSMLKLASMAQPYCLQPSSLRAVRPSIMLAGTDPLLSTHGRINSWYSTGEKGDPTYSTACLWQNKTCASNFRG